VALAVGVFGPGGPTGGGLAADARSVLIQLFTVAITLTAVVAVGATSTCGAVRAAEVAEAERACAESVLLLMLLSLLGQLAASIEEVVDGVTMHICPVGCAWSSVGYECSHTRVLM
jgi:hypothetical protein